MDSKSEPTWIGGVCMVVNRDRAKQLFSAKTSDALNAFFDECCADGDFVASESCANCEGHWSELKQQLEELAGSASEEARPLLEWAARGFRPLADEQHSFLVRPDLVPPIAQALQTLELSGPTEVNELLKRISKVYEIAAADRAAVALFYRPA